MARRNMGRINGMQEWGSHRVGRVGVIENEQRRGVTYRSINVCRRGRIGSTQEGDDAEEDGSYSLCRKPAFLRELTTHLIYSRRV